MPWISAEFAAFTSGSSQTLGNGANMGYYMTRGGQQWHRNTLS